MRPLAVASALLALWFYHDKDATHCSEFSGEILAFGSTPPETYDIPDGKDETIVIWHGHKWFSNRATCEADIGEGT